MKAKILELLKAKMPEYVSGEQISRSLEVSRTAIWKHIKALREDGYSIESRSRNGYRLASLPDRLYPAEITGKLETRFLGNGVVHFESIGSTNDVAKQLASSGAPEGLIVVAEEQSQGRGRLGREWCSTSGKGIWMSVVLRPGLNPVEAPKITLLASVALARSLSRWRDVEPGIKWPNDLLLKGKKFAGILTEMSAELDRINYVVVGIGINVNSELHDFPASLQAIATSLYKETKRKWSRLDLLTVFLKEFEELYIMFKKGEYDELIGDWKRYSITLNRKVRVSSSSGIVEGLALDLADDGSLLVQNEDMVTKVLAGEVTLREEERN